jgi:hypothetical protein
MDQVDPRRLKSLCLQSMYPFSINRRRSPRSPLPLPFISRSFASGAPPPTFRTFRCVRHTYRTVGGSRTLFRFMGDQTLKFSATFKTRAENFIPIVSGNDVHLGGGHWDAVLLYGNAFCDFSLRLNSRTGAEVMSLQFRRFHKDGSRPRKLSVFLFGEKPGWPSRLEAAEPRCSDDMAWSVDLNSDSALSSIKNCKLESMGVPYCYVRKMRKNELEVEGRTLDDICLFAITIGSFLCRK